MMQSEAFGVIVRGCDLLRVWGWAEFTDQAGFSASHAISSLFRSFSGRYQFWTRNELKPIHILQIRQKHCRPNKHEPQSIANAPRTLLNATADCQTGYGRNISARPRRGKCRGRKIFHLWLSISARRLQFAPPATRWSRWLFTTTGNVPVLDQNCNSRGNSGEFFVR